YEFHDQSVNRKYTDGKKTVAEADVVLENGEYILLAEIKTEPRGEDVDEHIARIEKVRAHMDRRNDRRKILGAIAGGVVPDKVLAYAQGGGLFVITLSGESAALAALPEGFTPRVW
ncbi:MAG: hypothetical protein LBI44_00380, partial [Oscillospiraceae bacterium]|nr:hypothetical protein [Oscillospiraceae bacterium]